MRIEALYVIIIYRDLRFLGKIALLCLAMSTESPEVNQPKELDRYECSSCGYTYEPTKGDSRSQIPANTAFEDLPSNWRCPVCGVRKVKFQNVGPAGSPSGFKENLGYGLGVNSLTPGQKNLLIFGGLALGIIFFLSLYGLQ